MSKYVYIRSEPELWTVGFYDPNGKWNPESDFNSPEKAADRVHWLNGGSSSSFLDEALNEGSGVYKP